MSSNFKMAIKWEGICQLWNNHIVVLEKLIKSYREYKWFLDKEPLITMGALKEFLHLVNIEDNNNFCDDVFSLFEKEEKIDIKEFFQSVIIVSDNSYEKKSKFIVDVWENNQTGLISFKVISRLLKFACHSKKDYDAIIHKIKEVVEDLEMKRYDEAIEIFHQCRKYKGCEADADEQIQLCLKAKEGKENKEEPQRGNEDNVTQTNPEQTENNPVTTNVNNMGTEGSQAPKKKKIVKKVVKKVKKKKVDPKPEQEGEA